MRCTQHPGIAIAWAVLCAPGAATAQIELDIRNAPPGAVINLIGRGDDAIRLGPHAIAPGATVDPNRNTEPRGVPCNGTAIGAAGFFSVLTAFDDGMMSVIRPQRIVDNFQVSTPVNGAATLLWYGSFFGDDGLGSGLLGNENMTFRITIYNDDDGHPGSVHHLEDIQTTDPTDNVLAAVNGDGGAIIEHTLACPTLTLDANMCYWIEIVANNDSATGWAWMDSDTTEPDDDTVSFFALDANSGWCGLERSTRTDQTFCINGGLNFAAGLPDTCPPLGADEICSESINDLGNDNDGCHELDHVTGAGFQSASDTTRIADDFTALTAGSISEVCVGGFYIGGPDLCENPDAFEVRFYANNTAGIAPRPRGMPDEAMAIYTGFSELSGNLVLRKNTESDIVEATMILDPPLAVGAGECLWIEVINDKLGNDWVWLAGLDGNNRLGVDGLFVGTVPNTGYDPLEIIDATAIGASFTNVAFCINIAEIDDGEGCDLPDVFIGNDFCGAYGANGDSDLAINGATQTGVTFFALGEAAPHCGTVSTGTPDVWHRVVSPTAQNITISTDFPGTDYDTTLHVYCSPSSGGDECSDLRCVAANDDGATALARQSELTFAAEPNREYYIRLGGFGGVGGGAFSGNYEIGATGDGDTAALADPCDIPCEVDQNATSTEIAGDCAADLLFAFQCDDDRSNPAEALDPAAGDHASGWLRANDPDGNGPTRDADTWTISHPGGVLGFDFDNEMPIIFDLQNDANTCTNNASVIDGAIIIPQICDEFIDLQVSLPAGEYFFLLIPPTFYGGDCENVNTEYDVELSLVATGACCFADGTCSTDLSHVLCENTANNGLYSGDGIDCHAAMCPAPMPCCLGDGSCIEILPSGCAAMGGNAQGPGTCYGVSGTPTTRTNTATIAIPDNDPAGAVSTINMPDSFIIGDISVEIDIPDHPAIGDLVITLSHAGESVTLWANQCAQNAGLQATFTDVGAPEVCVTPTVGFIRPAEPLAAFDGLDASGDWTLSVTDIDAPDSGNVASWSITIDGRINIAAAGCINGCPCEFGGDPTEVDFQDLLAFLSLWFVNDASADINGDGVSVTDLLDFLDCWFASSTGTPCP